VDVVDPLREGLGDGLRVAGAGEAAHADGVAVPDVPGGHVGRDDLARQRRVVDPS